MLTLVERSPSAAALRERSADVCPAPAAALAPVLSSVMNAPIQPVADVAEYLEQRRPRPTIDGEECLLVTLPESPKCKLQSETRALVRACLHVQSLVKDYWPVRRACIEALRIFYRYGWALKTFEAKYYAWADKQDWTVLVNKSKAPASWRAERAGLPALFLEHCEKKIAKFGRRDGKRQAIISIRRHWKTGRDETGRECVIPGYEDGGPGASASGAATGWEKRDTENCPVGWHPTNISRQIQKRNRLTKAVRAQMHESHAAALPFLPGIQRDTTNLRFLEEITFDDVRMDWLVFNTETGQAEELWLLVARDSATRMVLGFVMHPASIRDDGTATHLGARHMKELAAYILETYPLPPYLVHWIVERGTATLAEAVKAALGELFDNRIKVHYTSMIGGKSPVGYQEKAKGNSRGKASHESHNRLFHTQASHLPGQTGARYDIRPADLNARVEEAKEIWNLASRLPEHKRGDVKFPLVTQKEARDIIKAFCLEQNLRVDHAIEGFEDVLEWWDGQKWQPRSKLASNANLNNGPGASAGGAATRFRQRKEMPVERAMRLIQAVGDCWTRCSPEIIRTFLEHTQKLEVIEPNGEIIMPVDGKPKTFCHAGQPLPSGMKVLCYHNPDDPQYIHLTTGDGRFLGTWYQRGRTPTMDQKALAEAFRYTKAAAAAAESVARDLAAPQVAELEAMRAHNAALMAEQNFVVVTSAPESVGQTSQSASPISAALTSTKTQKQIAKQKQRDRERFERIADAAIANITP
ncbi:MAG TPA: hypothetical protein VGY56_10550 [Verrucomicrobiae bacterium]|nr:hypothetical protein [Verrucomicrobiae bacterium]